MANIRIMVKPGSKANHCHAGPAGQSRPPRTAGAVALGFPRPRPMIAPAGIEAKFSGEYPAAAGRRLLHWFSGRRSLLTADGYYASIVRGRFAANHPTDRGPGRGTFSDRRRSPRQGEPRRSAAGFRPCHGQRIATPPYCARWVQSGVAVGGAGNALVLAEVEGEMGRTAVVGVVRSFLAPAPGESWGRSPRGILQATTAATAFRGSFSDHRSPLASQHLLATEHPARGCRTLIGRESNRGGRGSAQAR
jgi:hypothetical protein